MKRELQPWHPAPESSWRPPAARGLKDHFFQATLLHAQLHRYAQALRHRWWVMALSLGLIGGPALYYAWQKPPSYQARAQMYFSGKQNEDSALYIATQAQLLKSPPILTRAFRAVRIQYPALSGGIPLALPVDSPFQLAVRSSTKTEVVELTATGPEPLATRAFLEAVKEEYRAFKVEQGLIWTEAQIANYSNQVYEVNQDIRHQRDRLTQFETSNNVAYLEEMRRNAGNHLATLSGTLSDLKTERETLELMTPEEFEKFAGTVNTALETVYYTAKQQLQGLRAQRDKLAAVLRPEHSKMVKLEQDIAALEQQVALLEDDRKQQAIERMNNRKKTLDLQILSKASEHRSWETNAVEATRVLVEHDRMQQEVQRLQAHHDSLATRLQELIVQVHGNENGGSLWPLGPSSIARPTLARQSVAAAGLFLAVLVGLGVFMLLEFLNDQYTSPREVSLQMEAEVIGTIPQTNFTHLNGSHHLLPLTTAQPAFAESFRNLRSSLLFMPGQQVPPKVVLITSSIPREGKTTVASNLAGILAMGGARVLLVDADFRRGYIHRIFRVRRKPGLLEVLTDQVPLSQAIVASGQPNLDVLPAGETGEYTSDVLLRYRVDRLLQALAKNYDHVILDSAPVLATDDAACLGPHTDGAYLVVRGSYTSSRMTQEAWGHLSRRNVKILGVIYNCASASTDYYSHYSREYGAERTPEFLQAHGISGNGDETEAASGR